jgi:hypothetical protein
MGLIQLDSSIETRRRRGGADLQRAHERVSAIERLHLE